MKIQEIINETKRLKAFSETMAEDVRVEGRNEILQVRKRGNWVYYYKRKKSDGNEVYLHKGQEEEIKRLEELNYFRKLEKTAKTNVKILGQIELLLGQLKDLDDVFFNIPREKRHLIKPYVSKQNKVVLKEPDRRKEAPKDLNYITSAGDKVRSKSEYIISEKLIKNEIQFYYEYPVHIGHTTIFSDFYVLNEKESKSFYWEHLGKMDDPEYRQNAMIRLESYADAGIVLGKNLIVTMESSERPLNTEFIDKIINILLK